jgi:hypothetical protein
LSENNPEGQTKLQVQSEVKPNVFPKIGQVCTQVLDSLSANVFCAQVCTHYPFEFKVTFWANKFLLQTFTQL